MSTATGRKHICDFCFQHCSSEEILGRHLLACNKTITKLPEKDKNILKFHNFRRQLEAPFVVYSDFECVLERTSIARSTVNDNVKSVQAHKPVAYSYYIKCSFDDSLNKFKTVLKEDVNVDIASHFVQSLFEDCTPLFRDYIFNEVPMLDLTDSEKLDFSHATHCHICEDPLQGPVVKDHCHLTGKYRGAAHQKCNLEYQVASFIPVFFHNFSAYDCHLFVKSLEIIPGEIEVIASTKEKYTCMTKRFLIEGKGHAEIRFLDSYRFLPESLDTLSSTMPKENFHCLSSQFKNPGEIDLLTRKGVFPYDYLDSMERLAEPRLPSIEKFYNKLTDKNCEPKDYEHAQNVWNFFNCRTLGDYITIYLKTDVLLLADIMENFRKVCLNIYKLDPCQFITLPGFSWEAMLKHTKVELELLTDLEMVYFVKQGIRGGLVQCNKKHSVANNQYLSNYDPLKPKLSIVYLDANNLYGWAMSEYLPYGGFKWVENINDFNIDSISETSDIGYILEVDLDYPIDIHDAHNDLPFCAKNQLPPQGKTKKLITDLNNKSNYIIHYRTLQQCKEYGLEIKKIHKILQFNQAPWLKSYIDLNTSLRAQAKNDFEKSLFKLLNNSIYGKTIENVEKRKNIKLIDKWENSGRRLGARALIARPGYKSFSKFTETMGAVEMEKDLIFYNKPIYVGFSVLELSKWKMYNFHYKYMVKKFPGRLALNYMDTDSFIYTIETNDFYKEIIPDIKEQFDTSDYPLDNRFKIPLENKKVLGMMKDELKGVLIKEFIGLRSKMYAIIPDTGKEIKRAKGVRKCIVDKLSAEDYRLCLLQNVKYHREMIVFKSYEHEIFTNSMHKLVLSNTDDKRTQKANKIDTYAHGHFQLALRNVEGQENWFYELIE